MKQKVIVRALCLLLAVLMVMGVMVSALSTLTSAAVVKKKNSVHTARQPDLTFYDLNGNVLGTFSHSASSKLIGFNNTRVIYIDDEGEEIEVNYDKVDVTLHLNDGTGKYSEMTSTRENSYYVKYNMGSSVGEAFSNRITCSKGSDDTINLDVKLPNVVFRDSNEMKMNIIYQYPYTSKSTTGKTSTYIRTRTETLTFAFTKAKIDLTVTKPKKNSVVTDSNTGATTTPDSGYGDKDQLNKDKTLSGSVSVMQTLDANGNVISKTQGDTTTGGDQQNTDQNGNNSQNNTGDQNNTGGQNNNNNNNNNGNTNGDGSGEDSTPPVSAAFETPYLLLQEYSTGASQVAAGSEFTLDFTCKNTSQQIDLENIIVKVAPGEGLQIVDTTNVFYLPIINKDDTYEQQVQIAVLPNAQAGSHSIDISFSYEYVLSGARQKGEMTQQVSVETIQPDRFSADPIEGLLESSVGEEIYITSKYVNKSRGDIYNLSARLVGDFNGANQVNHIGNVAAGVSGDVEFSFTPNAAGPLSGEIAYTYEDASGNLRSVSVPFSTTILEAPTDDMMTGMDMGGVDMMEPETPEPTLWDQLRDPNSWQMWAAIGGVCVVVVVIVLTIRKRRKAAAEFEDDDENI